MKNITDNKIKKLVTFVTLLSVLVLSLTSCQWVQSLFGGKYGRLYFYSEIKAVELGSDCVLQVGVEGLVKNEKEIKFSVEDEEVLVLDYVEGKDSIFLQLSFEHAIIF
ncbi:MAG: hypothetical protein LBQ27_06730 [Clostridiales bacterium]|jgi:hypothetical protein|nr:hypothetical protein [Clostridiales bacterium]